MVLVGFSMAPARSRATSPRTGRSGVRKAALLGTIPPFVLKTDDTPRASTPRSSTTSRQPSPTIATHSLRIPQQLQQRRRPRRTRISDRAWQASFNVAVGSSPFASYACVDTWLTDFRADLPKIGRAGTRRARHGGPHPSVRVDRGAASGADCRLHARPGRGRTAQHRLDACRRGPTPPCSRFSVE